MKEPSEAEVEAAANAAFLTALEMVSNDPPVPLSKSTTWEAIARAALIAAAKVREQEGS